MPDDCDEPISWVDEESIDKMLQESASDEDLVTRLGRIRAVICPNHKYGDEVERCPCVRGGRDAGHSQGQGQTGCKDLMDAQQKIKRMQNNDE